jgi:hypothetical protein
MSVDSHPLQCTASEVDCPLRRLFLKARGHMVGRIQQTSHILLELSCGAFRSPFRGDFGHCFADITVFLETTLSRLHTLNAFLSR